MFKYLLAAIAGIGLIGVGVSTRTTPAVAAQTQGMTAVFLPDGKVKLPTGFRKWVFVGAPLTPNGLNNGNAGFGRRALLSTSPSCTASQIPSSLDMPSATDAP
jgi:hypothetical protein